jgi:hypothetical protein
MINNVNSKVESIINNDSNVTVSYDLDVVRPNSGIAVNRNIPNRISIENINQQYNISNNSITNVFSNNIITLSKFSNYIVHANQGNSIVLTSDLQIFINDLAVSWKKGQVLRLVFDDEIIPEIFDIKVYTDKKNIMNSGEYGVQIASFNDLDFTPSLNKPIFDIICINDTQLAFRVDKIR